MKFGDIDFSFFNNYFTLFYLKKSIKPLFDPPLQHTFITINDNGQHHKCKLSLSTSLSRLCHTLISNTRTMYVIFLLGLSSGMATGRSKGLEHISVIINQVSFVYPLVMSRADDYCALDPRHTMCLFQVNIISYAKPSKHKDPSKIKLISFRHSLY